MGAECFDSIGVMATAATGAEQAVNNVINDNAGTIW
jgi:hypothetical protein